MQSIRIGPFLLSPHKRCGRLTGRWLVDIPATLAGGRRKRKLFENRKDAQKFARELYRRLRDGELGAARSVEHGPKSFRAICEKWSAFQDSRVETGKKRKRSHECDAYRLRVLLRTFGSLNVGHLDEERVVAFQAARLRVGRQPATVNSDVRVLMKVLRWAVRKGWLDALPEVERLPEDVSDTVVPTQEEVGRIIDNLPARLKPLVRLIAQTGCRTGEVFNLTWDRVDLEAGWIELRPDGQWTPKTRSSIRRVPIAPDLVAALAALPRESTYVFPGHVPGKPHDNIKKAFATAVRKARIERNGMPLRVAPQTLRKATATWLAVDRGVPQRVLQSILGHAPGSAVTNRYYVTASDETKRRALEDIAL